MPFELFVALRYLHARRKQAFITVISVMSVLGVALGVAALVIVLGVYNGFSTDIRDKILSANAHILVSGPFSSQAEGGDAAGRLAAALSQIRSTKGVTGATPFLYAEGMVSSSYGVKGLVMRGVDPASALGTIAMLEHLTRGSPRDLERPSGAPGVILGQELASRLRLRIGSRVNLLSPAGQKSSAGFQPRIRPFRVVGIFHSGMYEYDTSMAYISLQSGRDLMGLANDAITGIEVAIHNVDDAEKIAGTLRTLLGPDVIVRTWMDMNANLFAALKLERIGMFIVLAMVVLVGSFSIVTMLVMLVMEKRRDIAILMSMGATRGMIRRIFMLQGTVIGLIGTFIGYALGIGISVLLQRYQFIKLPPGVYTIDHLPMLLRWSDIALVGTSAMLLCFLATIYPARQAAALEPAEALRYE